MSDFKLISDDYASEFQEAVNAYIKLNDIELDCFIKNLDGGKRFIKIIENELLSETIKEINDLCNIEKVNVIMKFFLSVAYGYDNSTYEKIMSDLDKLNIDREGIDKLKIILDNFEQMKEDLISLSERKNLADETLPSLSEINISLDVRYKIDDEKILHKTPVLLIALETDSSNEKFYFQTDLGMTRLLISELSDYYNTMKQVYDELLQEERD